MIFDPQLSSVNEDSKIIDNEELSDKDAFIPVSIICFTQALR